MFENVLIANEVKLFRSIVEKCYFRTALENHFCKKLELIQFNELFIF